MSKKKEPEKTEKIEKVEIVNYEYKPKLQLNTVNIRDIVGEVIVIKSVEFKDTSFGKLAIVETADHGRYHTFSKVMLDQLEKEIKPMLDQGKYVRVKVVRVRRYLRFDSP
ncbi:MAG: hypothetical protein QXO72_04260 [Sulfolobales archaeon]